MYTAFFSCKSGQRIISWCGAVIKDLKFIAPLRTLWYQRWPILSEDPLSQLINEGLKPRIRLKSLKEILTTLTPMTNAEANGDNSWLVSQGLRSVVMRNPVFCLELKKLFFINNVLDSKDFSVYFEINPSKVVCYSNFFNVYSTQINNLFSLSSLTELLCSTCKVWWFEECVLMIHFVKFV